jgi:transcriptional regulator with XRE-family HTH domain
MATPLHIAQRLKHIRMQQHLTLKQVEIKSRGKWKAVVVGSYERGTRSLSVAKAEELCNFYSVPLSALLHDEPRITNANFTAGLTLDLRKLRALLQTPDEFSRLIYGLLNWITKKREDWNGEVLSIRSSDIETLGIITAKSNDELVQALNNRELWLTKQDRA